MDAPDVLARLSMLGVRLTREGEAIRAAPRSALTDETRELIRAHKAQLLAVLESNVLPDRAAEARRQRVLAMLRENPNLRRSVIADTEADYATVIVAVAIRDVGTCELRIPRAKWDPIAFLEAVQRSAVQ